MSNFFNPDNPVTKFLSLICDLIMLNILFIITCIPIFTIGCAISSMYHVTLKIIAGDSPYIIKTYFKAFRDNFKQATIIWIPSALLLSFFTIEIRIIYTVIDPKYTSLQYPVLIMIYAIVSVLLYAFPLLATYKNSIKQILKNSVLLSLGNIPTSIFFVVILGGIGFYAKQSPENFIVVFSLSLFCGFSVITYFFSLFISRIFEKINGEQTAENN